MKAQFHKLPLNSNSSFFYTRWDCPAFDKPWHFHEEYELVLIDKSRGTKFIGDAVSIFEEGDLLLIGPNIPHLFRNSEEYYKRKNKNKKSAVRARSFFVHFTDDFLGKDFFSVPEMKSVRNLLNKSSTALEIRGKIKGQIAEKLYEMEHEAQPRRLISLLDILLQLSESRELRPLLSTKFKPNTNTKNTDADRIHTILEYIMTNYSEKIYLSEIASMLGMSDATFSRYFKHHTRKTFSSYLTEVRISHACRLLMQGEQSIAQIGYLSGFENLANFYRHFKRITGSIPKRYRSTFLKISEIR